jgi:aminopeptidase YwaD
MTVPSTSSRFRTLALATLLLGGVACRSTSVNGAGSASVSDSTRLLQDVTVLSSESMEGRGTGTAGNDSAAAYIARRFEAIGLTPVVRRGDPATCAADAASEACLPGYVQPFEARSALTAHATQAPRTQNVLGVVRGTDPALRHQYVVVGAHFDHLGRSPVSSMDPQAGNAIRHGADDNASGTAVVLELARRFSKNPASRSMIFVAFSGEELGLLGSRWFVDNSPAPIDSITAMLNFDMVGRLSDNRLIVYGVETARELRAIVDSMNREAFALTAQGDGFGSSDHASFFAKGIPVLHFFTGIHGEYHRASDRVELINAGGMARVASYAERVAREIANRPARLTPIRAAAAAPSRTTREGTGVYLGSIPDMAAQVKGVKLMGVRAGSPADSAGIREGDVIVEFAGQEVTDLQTYSDALYARSPGDRVKVIVVRDGKRLELQVTLGRRGG